MPTARRTTRAPICTSHSWRIPFTSQLGQLTGLVSPLLTNSEPAHLAIGLRVEPDEIVIGDAAIALQDTLASLLGDNDGCSCLLRYKPMWEPGKASRRPR
jgi:hypothetical protein